MVNLTKSTPERAALGGDRVPMRSISEGRRRKAIQYTCDDAMRELMAAPIFGDDLYRAQSVLRTAAGRRVGV